MPKKLNSETVESVLLNAVINKLHHDVVEAYLKESAEGTQLSPDGNTVLHIAVLQNDLKMIDLLLKYNIKASIKNSDGDTPVVLAAKKNYWDCVIALANARIETIKNEYKYGDALLSATLQNQYDAAYALLKSGARLNWRDKDDGNFAIHEAVAHNNPRLVALLLQYNANLSDKNKADETPIVMAAKKNFCDCVIAIAHARKAMINKDGDDVYGYGGALLFATQHNRYKAVKALLEAGAVTKWFHSDSRNFPLHNAVINNNAAMVALLLTHHADPNKKNAKSDTPPLLASKYNFKDCALAFTKPNEFLIKKFDIQNIQMSLFYLFSAHYNQENLLHTLPYEILKIILDLSFGHLGPDFYDFDAAKRNYVDLRPDRQYICSVSDFIKNYTHYGIWRQPIQSKESITLANTLKGIVEKHEPVNERAKKAHEEISTFVTKKSDNKSRAVQLLIQHNLFKPDTNNNAVPKQKVESANLRQATINLKKQ